jgi:hypothetical protein
MAARRARLVLPALLNPAVPLVPQALADCQAHRSEVSGL